VAPNRRRNCYHRRRRWRERWPPEGGCSKGWTGWNVRNSRKKLPDLRFDFFILIFDKGKEGWLKGKTQYSSPPFILQTNLVSIICLDYFSWPLCKNDVLERRSTVLSFPLQSGFHAKGIRVIKLAMYFFIQRLLFLILSVYEAFDHFLEIFYFVSFCSKTFLYVLCY
jgi:hypothetical protein